MCVIAFAWNAHPRWRLLLVGNRDELHARPTAALQPWERPSGLFAGRDLLAGGTWMGATASGRVAVVTNVRDPAASGDGLSRGLLVTDYLDGGDDAAAHAAAVLPRASDYRPFNLLLFDTVHACYLSNRPASRSLDVADGIHGLSNGDLDSAWPKVRRAGAALDAWLRSDADDTFTGLLDAFADTTAAPDATLPDTGVGIDLERALSPMFVRNGRYGTRATTVIAIERDGRGCMLERRFGPDGVALGQTTLRWPG